MKWGTIIAIIMLIAIVACGPAEKAQVPAETQDTEVTEPTVKEEVTAPAQPQAETTTQAPEASKEELAEPSVEFEPYTQLGCESLLSAETFAQTCNQTVENVVVTYRVGTRNCFVNVKHREQERLTAGITLTQYSSSEYAMNEFDRRLKVYNVGADSTVGDKAFLFPKQDRETVNFVKGAHLVEVGSDTRLCSKHDLVVLANKVDAKLK